MRRVGAARLAFAAMLTTLTGCTHVDQQPRSYLVYFDTDSAILTADGQRVVATAASAAHDFSPSKVIVSGRADGSTAHDAALADQRATVVMQALGQQGVAGKDIEKQADAAPSGRTGVAAHEVVITLLP